MIKCRKKYMTLEEYKKEVEKFLVKQVGEKEANNLMKLYETDFPQFYEENWTPLGAGSAMMVGY